MKILPDRPTTVDHPLWCDTSTCMATPDWECDGTGFVGHHGRVLDVDGLVVEIVQGDTVSAQGELLERDPIAVQVGGAGWRELTPAQAERLAAALVRAAAVARGVR